MKLADFRFDLPYGLVKLRPAQERDEARLMVVHRQSNQIEHRLFRDLVDYVDEEDTLVLNDTKVYFAHLDGHKDRTGAKIEVRLLRELKREDYIWDVLVDPARKIRIGNKIRFGDELVAEVLDNTTSRGRVIGFHFNGTRDELLNLIHKLGKAPLPEGIDRPSDELDKEHYQTIYAKSLGATTAPFAGLHFTKHLLKRLEIKGVHLAYLTMHMGTGSIQKVNVEDLSKFKMESENFIIHPDVSECVNRTLAKKKRVIAVGVGTSKALESTVSVSGELKPREGWTNRFIFPPYRFRICSAFITNFHLPQSTMLMHACAFGGYERIMDAYQEAIKERYGFFSYGDAMLIL